MNLAFLIKPKLIDVACINRNSSLQAAVCCIMHTTSSPAHLPSSFREVLNSGRPAREILENVLSLVTESLEADRCFLYLRNPEKEKGRIEFCWCRNPAVPDVKEPVWKNDTQELPKEDPLFAAALKTKPSIYIEDILTADSAVVNRGFEEKTFGHRALIHAHITENGQLWGILQPAVFGAPRIWTVKDHQLIESLLPELIAPVKNYMQSVRM